VGLSLSLDAQSEQALNRSNTASLAPRAFVGAALAYTLRPGLELSAEARNLLDDQRQQDLFGYPLPGRAFRVTLQYTPTPPSGDTP